MAWIIVTALLAVVQYVIFFAYPNITTSTMLLVNVMSLFYCMLNETIERKR